MANGAEVLREYVALLGWKVKDDEWRKFQGNLIKAGEVLGELALATSTVAVAIDEAVTVMAARFEKLYYASVLAGSSAKNLVELEAGAQKIGMTAGEATSAVQRLASALRSDPGSSFLLRSLGVDASQVDKTKVFIDLIDKLKAMGSPGSFGYNRAVTYAGMFGIDEPHLKLLEDGNEELKRGIALRAKMLQDAGLDPGAVAESSVRLQNDLRDFRANLEILEDVILTRFLPPIDWMVRHMTTLIGYLSRADKATGGKSSWAAALGTIAVTAMGLKNLPSIVGFLLKRIGLGGLANVAGGEAAAAAAGGAGGTAAAAGGGVLTTVLLPVVAAVLAGLGLGWLLKKTGALDVGGSWSAHNEVNAIRKWFGFDKDPKASVLSGMPATSVDDFGVAGNNPGNLRSWGDNPQIIKGSAGRFASFSSTMEGLSALAGQLLRYSRRGLDTVSKIISTYAPKADHNNTEAYIERVSRALGVGRDSRLDLHNTGTLETLMHAIVRGEIGRDPYSHSLMQSAIQQRLVADAGVGPLSKSMHSVTTITVNGAGNPQAVGKAVGDEQGRVYQDAMRNFVPKVN